MVTLVSQEVRTARKPHQCDWCYESIEVGKPYVRQSLVDGSEFYNWIAHPECHVASSRLSDADLECSAGVQFTRGCTCESRQHDDGASWPCEEPLLTADSPEVVKFMEDN